MAFKQRYEIDCDHKDGCAAHDLTWAHKSNVARWHFEKIGWTIIGGRDAICPKHSNRRQETDDE